MFLFQRFSILVSALSCQIFMGYAHYFFLFSALSRPFKGRHFPTHFSFDIFGPQFHGLYHNILISTFSRPFLGTPFSYPFYFHYFPAQFSWAIAQYFSFRPFPDHFRGWQFPVHFSFGIFPPICMGYKTLFFVSIFSCLFPGTTFPHPF